LAPPRLVAVAGGRGAPPAQWHVTDLHPPAHGGLRVSHTDRRRRRLAADLGDRPPRGLGPVAAGRPGPPGAGALLPADVGPAVIHLQRRPWAAAQEPEDGGAGPQRADAELALPGTEDEQRGRQSLGVHRQL